MRKETLLSTPTPVAPADPNGAATIVRPPGSRPGVIPPRGRAAGRPKSRLAKRGMWTAVGVGLAVVVAVALRPHPVPVETALAARATLLVTVDEDGRTRMKNRYLVSSPLAGTVARTDLEPGDSVVRGAVIARIMPTAAPLLDPRSRAESQARVAAMRAALRQAGTAVERARVAYTMARREAERQRALLQAGATAPQLAEQAETAERMRQEELASSEFGLQVAASELRLANAALARMGVPGGEDFPVRAPVSGHVLRVLQESEAVVQPGTPLLEIGSPEGLEVVVDVLTSDAVGIRPGAAVRIERWGGDSSLPGHVHRIEPSAFTRVSALGVEEQRVNVIIDLEPPQSGWARLGDGYRVEASIAVWEGHNRLTVPAGAVFRQGEGWATYVVEGGRAWLRSIQLGRRNATAVEVLEGLRAGERVVVYPTDKVTDRIRTEIQ